MSKAPMKRPIRSGKSIRLASRVQILQYIDHKGTASRTQLAKDLGLSKATVSEHVSQLLEQGILLEKGHAPGQNLGRKSIDLALNGDYRYFISIDLSASLPLIVLCSLNNRHINETNLHFPSDADYETRKTMLIHTLRNMLEESKIEPNKLAILAICAPGYFNPKTKAFFADGVFALWEMDRLSKELGKAFACKVYLANDVNAAAVGEHNYAKQNGLGANNMLFIRAGWGLGAALIIENNLFVGSEGKAGEISDTFFYTRKTPLALQTEDSHLTIRHLLHYVKKHAPVETKKLLALKGLSVDKVSFSDLISLQRAGDAFISHCLHVTAELIAAFICNTSLLLDIQDYILSGEYLETDRSFLPTIQKFVKEKGYTDLRINSARLRHYAGISGLTALARQHILEQILEGSV